MEWIYLSPHLDDAVLSCGGLIWSQSAAGERAAIWTLCAGDPPEGGLSDYARSLHARWEYGSDAVYRRREEDITACERLGADHRHMSVPDCIYRRDARGAALYTSDEAIFGPLAPGDEQQVDALHRELAASLPRRAQIVCPLTLGGHIDHRLARRAAERLERELWYYADFPYVLEARDQIGELLPEGAQIEVFPVDALGMTAWGNAVAAYASQLSTFWANEGAMRAALEAYQESWGGVPLWRLRQG